VDYETVTALAAVGPRLRDGALDPEIEVQIDRQVGIGARYAGYLERQRAEIARLRRHEQTLLPADLDYARVPGLSNEARQKLGAQRPATVGQAARIPGLTPAAVSLLLVHLKRRGGDRRRA
jgi:tRNA uridine 5-carboxymethylaminomethyl modification enzyme